VNRAFPAPDPIPTGPVPATEPELTRAVARALSRRYAELGRRAHRGTAEATVFGHTVAAIRTGRGLSRTELARRARIDPVYLALVEMGLLGPDEIPAAVVARLAAGVGRLLPELPLTPYPPGGEPGDEVDARPGGTRLRLGLETLRPWVEALVGRPEPPPSALRLPDVPLHGEAGRWLVTSGQLGSPSAGPDVPEEYRWRVVRAPAAGRRWALHAQVLDAATRRPAGGVRLELRMGGQRRLAATDPMGEVRFADLDPADLEPLLLAAV
jgi:transcriptional regulator with XRE-family HTH domain